MAYALVEIIVLSFLLIWQLLSSCFIFYLLCRSWIHLGHTCLTAVNVALAALVFSISDYSYTMYLNINPHWYGPGGLCTFTLLLGSYSATLLSTSLMFLTGDTMMLARNPLLYISRMDTFHLFDKVVSPFLLASLISLCLLGPTATLSVDTTGECTLQPHDNLYGYYFGLPFAHYIFPAFFIIGFTIASIVFARRTLRSRPQVKGGDHVDQVWVLSRAAPVWLLVGVWVIIASLNSVSAFHRMGTTHNATGGEPLNLDGSHLVGVWSVDSQSEVLELTATWCHRTLIAIIPIWWALANPDARLLTLMKIGRKQTSISSSLVTITSVL